ncbi:DUF2628 domain-containing protein [Futiania mangrovi]|uniref:DUF2628 domain-containing protein n=1 Tax=Futiania mangrovi TaxID=2959716 RepID=A0A9J6PF75_9PROT|nr:DUF2628 domain-containing protein [Futiania mangrovii]MCP1336480.1 DUF2628 domain-containing protein [Futiania mangrovii]
MRVYTVHVRDTLEDAVFVRDGFAWLAFLFPAVWLLVHRLWWETLGYVVLAGLLFAGLGAAGVAEVAMQVAFAALNLLVGFEANELLRSALGRRGWTEMGSVVARNTEEAEVRFYADPPMPVRRTAPAERPWSGSGEQRPVDLRPAGPGRPRAVPSTPLGVFPEA